MRVPSCDTVRPLLFALLEREVTAAERVEITAHLAHCEACRAELEDERALTSYLRGRARPAKSRRVLALVAATVTIAFLLQLWLSGPRVGGTMFQSVLGVGLEWQQTAARSLSDTNHVALESGLRASIDVTDVGRIDATGPVAFELDRTARGWKVTLLRGELAVDVVAGATLEFACERGAAELEVGAWTLIGSGAARTHQDSTAALLRRADQAFQELKDMAAAERDYRAVLSRTDRTAAQHRRAMYLLWCAQQHQQKHADAVATIERWLAEFPDDGQVPRVLFHKGLNLAMQGRTDDAQAEWRAVIERFPDHEMAATAREWSDRYRLARGTAAAVMSSDERWARECATEIPWHLDRRTAVAASAETGKPLLVYVRCTHRSGAFESARASVAAPGVGLRDAGYAKDLLFRAGALADTRAAAAVRDRFVPLMVTYDFHSHGKGIADANWLHAGMASESCFDPGVGAGAPGSLTLSAAGSLLQSIVKPEHRVGDEFRFTAKARTRGGSGSVRIYWSVRGGDQVHDETAKIAGDRDWTELTWTFVPDAPLINVLVMPTLTGVGRAWFDDLELVRYRGGVPIGSNLLRNGACSAESDGADPLCAFGLRALDIATPALLAVAGGVVTHRLHRVGAIGPDRVLEWLRDAAADSGPLAPRPESLRAGHAALLAADWEGAERAFAGVSVAAHRDEAGFLRGMALHRLGRIAEAEAQWRAVAGPTPHGRRAAACLVTAGPRLPQALSLRAWRAPAAPDSTEVADASGFDPVRAIDILLELQQPNGAFVDHYANPTGETLATYWDIAYSAIAGDALRRWRGRVDGPRRTRIDRAVAAIEEFLGASAQGRPRRPDAFNDPYALDYCVAAGERALAQRYVERIASAQQADGSWTVYGPERPTSFNTAQNLIALIHARDAGIDVAAKVIAAGTAALRAMRNQDGRFSYAPKPGFRWMTTPVGGVAREPLCEHALLLAGSGSRESVGAALERFVAMHASLRAPTKHYSDDFNRTGHGAYFFYYAHRNAVEAAELVAAEQRAAVFDAVREAVLGSREADDSFVDHALYGRVYGTAMALSILGRMR